MNTLELALQGAGKVLTAGLLFGAGMPIVYALAMRVLTIGSTETTIDGETVMVSSTLGRVLMGILMALIVAVIAIGILIIVASGLGKSVAFVGDFPFAELVSKKK